MRSSFAPSALNSPPCQIQGGGARRHPRPRIEVPRVGRQAPAWLSTTTDKGGESTHTNRSPINPVHFMAVPPPPARVLSVRGKLSRIHVAIRAGRAVLERRAFRRESHHSGLQRHPPRIRSQEVDPLRSRNASEFRTSSVGPGSTDIRKLRPGSEGAATHRLSFRVPEFGDHRPRGHGGRRNGCKSLYRADRPGRHSSSAHVGR